MARYAQPKAIRSCLKPILCATIVLQFACSGQPSGTLCTGNSVAGSGADNCATGGISPGGGSTNVTGGTTSTATTSSPGGSSAAGNSSASGGTNAVAGATSTGGSSARAGSSALATGGRTGLAATGGNLGTGATPSVGGATLGGASSTGGTSTAGGTSTTCGLPLPGQDGTNPNNPSYFMVDEACLPTPTAAAGFIDLQPVTYNYLNPSGTLMQGRTTTSSRIFYSFIPADKDPKNSPVFVFFNGGPGGSTTGVLFSYGTAPTTLHIDANSRDSSPKSNPSSWTQLGNLLYIDSRQAGFSYSTTNDPTNQTQRSAGYTQDSFNYFADAADFTRAILRILKQQPALQNNRVVVVGESYGGMRSALMLGMLLDPAAVGNSTHPYFYDAALSVELQNHFASVFKNEGTTPLTRSRIARQFGWQVLIQPGLDFADQWQIQNGTRCDPTYISTQRLQQLGILCPPSDSTLLPAGVVPSANIDANSTEALLNLSSLQLMLGGVQPTSISGLSSTTRAGAYRLITDDGTYPVDLSSWTSTQGSLSSYDRYYIDLNMQAYSLFQITSNVTRVIGYYFLQNLLDVHTFITRAALDFVVIPEVLPKSFMALDAVSPCVSDVSIDENLPTGSTRPGEMVFTYRDVFGVTAGTQRRIRFPTYANSGHPVTVYQPVEFLADVKAMLTETMP